MSTKSLDVKLEKIRKAAYTPQDFIIADAKDGDMAMGTQAPGPKPNGTAKNRADYLNAMESMTQSGLVDIMLMSASCAESLHQRKLFGDSAVTPAIRLNDTTDIWSARSSCYKESRSQPFASADSAIAREFAELGLYSMTFSNHLDSDVASLNAYNAFRRSAREHSWSHFLEVFNPAFDIGIASSDLGFYINDMIIKAIAGVTSIDSPKFLKLQFNGAKAMEDLSQYDPENLVVGILGGAKGTTRDTFELAHQAEQAGARVALFGRKINLSESPLDLVELMRKTIQQSLTPEQAVQEYHKRLGHLGSASHRSLSDDLQITEPSLMS